MMKDAYSFHTSQEQLDTEFDKMEATYKKILTRLGLEFRVVEADSGAIGGSGSKELMVVADSGEDTLAICESCEYGANIEVLPHYEEYSELEHEALDIVKLKGDDICPHCGGKLGLKKGIECGHIFKLGTTYSAPLQATYLDEGGKQQDIIMGTYGLGVSRIMAAIIEQHHDDKGAIWTQQSAPYLINIMISNIKDDAAVTFANELYGKLQANNIDVILDERKERFGFKIKDAELLGFPLTVIIGKSLSEGIVEVLNRQTDTKEEVQIDTLYDYLITKTGELL